VFAAQVTERLRPGTVHSYESCSDYLPLGEPGHSDEVAGCVNNLTSKRYITPTSTGMAPNSCLVQVEKWEGPPTGTCWASARQGRKERQ
jgi:anaerobic selenocysteine-containing dehydrogenase